MKNKHNINTISSIVLIFAGTISLLFTLLGLEDLGFTYISYSVFAENYIEWSVMAWPLVILLTALILLIIKLIKCTIPSIKTRRDSLSVVICFLDVLSLIGLMLLLSRYIIWPLYGGVDNIVTRVEYKTLDIIMKTFTATGITSLLCGSIISMCLVKRAPDNKKRA